MQKALVFVTNNRHKVDEVMAKIPAGFEILSLADIGFEGDIAETGDTFAANASIKSTLIYYKTRLNCFADDSGLEIDALGGEPGVYSARYAGMHGDHEANMDKVLLKMQGIAHRSARFKTVISLFWEGREYSFEGAVEGSIRTARSGSKGFGYDPIFEPLGYNITFAEMSLGQKNSISHRARAVEQMLQFLAGRG